MKTPEPTPPAPDSPPPVDLPASHPADDLSIPDLLHALHEGRLAAADLSAETRQQCIEHLTLEGFSTSEIAQLTSLSERTIRRDRAAHRKRHTMTPTLELSAELLGEYHRHLLASIQRMIRLSRDSTLPPYARLWADEAVTRAYATFLKTAGEMGFLEKGGHQLEYIRTTDPVQQKRFGQRLRGMRTAVCMS